MQITISERHKTKRNKITGWGSGISISIIIVGIVLGILYVILWIPGKAIELLFNQIRYSDSPVITSSIVTIFIILVGLIYHKSNNGPRVIPDPEKEKKLITEIKENERERQNVININNHTLEEAKLYTKRPIELNFIEWFDESETLLARLKTSPIIRDLEKYYIDEIKSYSHQTYLEFDNGIFVRTYPTNKEDTFKLRYVDFENKTMKLIEDQSSPINKVKKISNKQIKLIINNRDKIKTIEIKK